MKYIFITSLLSVAVFIVTKYGFAESHFDETTHISDAYNEYPVDLIDFKLTLVDYVRHVCEENEETLKAFDKDVSDCINSHAKAKQACTVKVFRLAPMKLSSRDELIQYWQEYKECTLPYLSIVG
ncbi:hypothetical protein NQT69_02020 [Pseudoalteromonas shioyasakiensis]|uniref:hypothetical protein n=1 Tax=Pseudoalteromonas shioyasakiensis TaxID=1190813 RepID=UPI002117CCDC|nr:hypothetical protein [Pseudoalteromonas shioyasakiensis]MCQ8876812.1 hypothetical protein [Pseudoalteromonas shioyasakiensis]